MKKEKILDRFWRHVHKTKTCWLWKSTIVGGYGRFYKAHKDFEAAHRFSFKIHFGRISKPMVCHRCDNKSCVRPSHLFEGTARDNYHDAAGKKRLKFGSSCFGNQSGENNVNSKLSDTDVIRIRKMHQRGQGLKVLAGKFKVSRMAISLIVRNQRRI